MNKELVLIKNLNKVFNKGEVCIAKDISFTINEGEVFTILGKSGSGKTTLLRMLAGLEDPDSGEIKINQKIVFDKDTNIPPNQREVLVVFQNYALLPHLNIASNITFGRNFSKDKLNEVLKKTNLEEVKDKFPHEISGGQQQRVSLARALIHKIKILLLDEPLSNIDSELRVQLRFELKSLIKEFGITVLFITHDKDDVFYLSDKIAIINNGSILQIGTPKEIYHNPLNLYCANFLGKITKIDDNKYARPEYIKICDDGDYEAIITQVVFCGSFYEITLFTESKKEILCNSYNDISEIGQTVKYKLIAYHN